jgi:hypothetical protein
MLTLAFWEDDRQKKEAAICDTKQPDEPEKVDRLRNDEQQEEPVYGEILMLLGGVPPTMKRDRREPENVRKNRSSTRRVCQT